jgi:hypothetical protein
MSFLVTHSGSIHNTPIHKRVRQAVTVTEEGPDVQQHSDACNWSDAN